MPTRKRTPAKNNQGYLYIVKKHPILFSILCIAAVTILSTFAYRYYEQQKTLNELSSVSKDLRVIYDKILASQQGNVASSYFRNECSESSVEVGRGLVTCGPSGYIYLKLGVVADDAIKVIKEAFDVNDLKNLAETVETSTNGKEISTKFRYSDMEIDCLVNHATDSTFYITCRKSAPDFLPGYVVAD